MKCNHWEFHNNHWQIRFYVQTKYSRLAHALLNLVTLYSVQNSSNFYKNKTCFLWTLRKFLFYHEFKIRSLFGFFITVTILLTLTQLNAVQGRNISEKCSVLSPSELKSNNCGKQFLPAHVICMLFVCRSAVLMRRDKKNPSNWKYFCGGTLINSVNVLTSENFLCLQSIFFNKE